MGHLEHYFIGKRNFKKENHWEELDSKSFKITKPTVLCFGGNATITPKDANKMCKIAQNLIGIKQPTIENEIATSSDVDFVGIAYGKSSENGVRRSSLTKEERNELAERIFLPLCLDKKGVPLSEEQILKNFNQITFFSHCWGTREICSIIGKGLHKMLDSGIAKATAALAFGQVFSVSYAPYQEYVSSGLQVISMKDRIILGPMNGAEISNKFLMDRFEWKGCQGDGTVAFKEDKHTVSVLVSDMTKHLKCEHNIKVVDRDENWHFIEEGVIYGDEVSQVMGNALASSVANSIQNQDSDTFIPKPSVDSILEEAQSILADTQSSKFEADIEQIRRELVSQQNEEISDKSDLTAEINQTSGIETMAAVPSENLQNASNVQLSADIEFEQ